MSHSTGETEGELCPHAGLNGRPTGDVEPWGGCLRGQEGVEERAR